MIDLHSEDGYIEPGSLLMILQVLIAGALAGLFMIGAFWRRVRHFVSSLFSRDKNSDD